jgi:hypothetical protein
MVGGRHVSHAFAASVLAVGLVGCSALRGGPEPPMAADTLIGTVTASQLPVGGPLHPPDDLADLFSPTAVSRCLGVPVSSQHECRNTIVQALLVAIEARYQEYEIRFFDANRYGGFFATSAALGLSAAGTVSSAGATQVLAAITTAITGTREAFGRDVLADQTAAALLTAMRAQRNIIALRIREGLTRDAATYPLGFAISDLYAYLRAGTIPGALAGVTQTVGAEAQRAQEELRAVGSGLSMTSLALRMRAFVNPPGAAEAERDRRMLSFIEAARAEGLGAIPAAALLRDASAEGEARLARIARRIGLGT